MDPAASPALPPALALRGVPLLTVSLVDPVPLRKTTATMHTQSLVCSAGGDCEVEDHC